jgi:hypothetical protein
LLVLAGRAPEALPILLGVADEQARYGFHEKALEALRRADAIEPRRPEVTRRFEDLALAVRKARTPSPRAPANGRPRRSAGEEARRVRTPPPEGDARKADGDGTARADSDRDPGSTRT